MAAPNIGSTATMLYKRSIGYAFTNSTGTILANAAGSSAVIEIISGIVANIDGSNAVDITLDVQKASGASFSIASTVQIPADSVLTVIEKPATIVLEEGDSLMGLASANSDTEGVFSYDEYAAS